VDEAGRGCFAGPVFAAAVVLPKGFHHPLLNDSKLLTEKQRDLLRPIIESESVEWSVASVPSPEIDRINILQASFKAMHLALNGLKTKPKFLLIDGNQFKPYQGASYKCIVKGDSTYASIAAASILAKTHRDELMYQLHNEFREYHWDKNKGYGTKEHREAILKYGLCKYHRRSFKLVDIKLFEI